MNIENENAAVSPQEFVGVPKVLNTIKHDERESQWSI
jgi:hypothetical protein